MLQLAGPNGVGKTSCLRALCGLLDYSDGLFRWRDRSVRHPYEYSDELLFLGHRPGVRLQMTALENLQWFCRLQSSGAQRRSNAELEQALAEVGLAGYEREFCAHLSAGQKRRVGLARLAISQARLWVLDEPFVALDAEGVQALVKRIENFVAAGGALLFTTHQQVNFGARIPRKLTLELIGETAQC